MGLEQPGDVTLPRNWWGSAEPAQIEQTFFDARHDPTLCRVRAPEPLAGPVAPTAWQMKQGDER